MIIFLIFPIGFSRKRMRLHSIIQLVFVCLYCIIIAPYNLGRGQEGPPNKNQITTPDMFFFPPLFLHGQRALVLSVSVSINLLTAPIAERHYASTYIMRV